MGSSLTQRAFDGRCAQRQRSGVRASPFAMFSVDSHSRAAASNWSKTAPSSSRADVMKAVPSRPLASAAEPPRKRVKKRNNEEKKRGRRRRTRKRRSAEPPKMAHYVIAFLLRTASLKMRSSR